MFNPEIMKWARESAGLSLADAAHRLDIAKVERLIAYETGAETPSRPVLLRMAKQYRRSLLTFYLQSPPPRGNRGEDFRTVSTDFKVDDDAKIDALIRDLRVRQSLVHSAMEDDETQPIPLIGSTHMSEGISHTIEVIQSALKLDLQTFRSKRKIEDAFSLLRTHVENIGIFVMLKGDLGSHHSSIAVNTFRGFAIADPIAPFIVINDQDAKSAWSFTLLHELAHLCLGATGISGSISDIQIEKFCNEVASEFLLPLEEFNKIQISNITNIETLISEISDYANKRNISRSLVAYKLFNKNIISKEIWKEIESRIRLLWQQEKLNKKLKNNLASNGPNYYTTKRHKLGDAILEFANRALNSGNLSPVKAAKILDVKPRSVHPLLINISQSGYNHRMSGLVG